MRHVVLSGFMGSGKTSVGVALAERLGRPFLDTDRRIAERAGKRTAGEVFAEVGEPRFREIEVEIALEALSHNVPAVIAFGGGTVTTRSVRMAALDRGLVVTLAVPVEAALARVATSEHRPNLAARDPGARARELLAHRREAYAECHAEIDASAPVPEVVDAVAALLSRRIACVPLGARTYRVEIAVPSGGGLLAREIARLSPTRVVAVTDRNVYTARFMEIRAELPTDAVVVVLEPGEREKTLHAVERIWDAALTAGCDRSSLLLAFGGGVVGDLTGFAAATLLRGVRFVQVPTTLLAMVDASVGGKTGFDRPEGKNLVGAFHQPSAVVVDVAHLSTLEARERAAGLAEVVKIALADDADLFDAVARHAAALASGDADAIREIVLGAVEAKIRVVRDDETEQGRRAILNLGHTVGHALEAAQGFSGLLHGEAVSIGTVVELRALEHLGLTPRGTAERASRLLASLSLPTRATRAELESAWRFVSSDKKRTGATLSTPVVTSVGASRVDRIGLDEFRAAVLETAPA